MPIRPELRHFYGRIWRTITRPRILARAGNKCEQCGVPNYKVAIRAAGWWTLFESTPVVLKFWYNDTAAELVWTPPNGAAGGLHGFPRSICRLVVIVLTVAHLNHVSGDDRDENLKALCQWCHLNYDQTHHRETREARKDRSRPLFTELTKATA